jgi:hypothetical protein
VRELRKQTGADAFVLFALASHAVTHAREGVAARE